MFSGALTILAGSFLINRMVIGEAQRRVDLALKTARAIWERRLDEALKACMAIAEAGIAEKLSSNQSVDPGVLNDLRVKCGYGFLHILDSRGITLATAYGDNKGAQESNSAVIARVLLELKPAAGLSFLPLRDEINPPYKLV